MDTSHPESDSSDQDDINLQAQLFMTIRCKTLTRERQLLEVEQLLDKGAKVNAKDANNRNNSVLHVAAIRGDPSVVRLLLERGANVGEKNAKNQSALEVTKYPEIQRIILGHIRNNSLKKVNQQIRPKEQNTGDDQRDSALTYVKRKGASGIAGQLYETKLLTMILVRALYSDDIEEFYLGTNVDGIGALDDVVFRYKSKQGQTHVLFVQAKHRDAPEKSKMLTLDEMLDENGSFSVLKYFEGYLEIVRKFNSDNEFIMFRNCVDEICREYMIFTSARENCSRTKLVQGNPFLSTEATNFRVDFEERHVELILEMRAKSRIELLAEALARYIESGETENILANELIKAYHVVLARDVLSLSDGKAVFRKEFFEANDQWTNFFRENLLRVILCSRNSKVDTLKMESIALQLPKKFGNLDLPKKTNHRLLATKFKSLCQRAEANNIVRITEDMVGKDRILNKYDTELNGGIAGMVGNLLVLDHSTNMLKFNSDTNLLGDNARKMLSVLQSELGERLNTMRFAIELDGFPRLSLGVIEKERGDLKTFLNHLTFYTKQATETELDDIVKNEIRKIYSIEDSVSLDAIFLRAHDKVQQWWKQSNDVFVLTEHCDFLSQAIMETQASPLLSNLGMICERQINKNNVHFRQEVVDQLKQRIKPGNTNFVTKHLELCCIQLLQCFPRSERVSFIDLKFWEFASVSLQSIIEMAERQSKTHVIISLSRDREIDVSILSNRFQYLIIVSEIEIPGDFSKIEQRFEFDDLAIASQNYLIGEIKMLFQGEELSLGVLLGSDFNQIVDEYMLSLLVRGTDIEIAKPYNFLQDYQIEEHFIERTLVRKKFVLKIDQQQTEQDLYTETEELFFEKCAQHEHLNVHLLKKEEFRPVWQRSRGTLFNLRKVIDNSKSSEEQYRVEDVNESVVIVAAEPGMGKSVLLNRLAGSLRKVNPPVWVVKVDLLMQTTQLNAWKNAKTIIGVEQALTFLINILSATDGGYKNSYGIQLVDDQIKLTANELGGLARFEVSLFVHLYNNGRMTILLDGYDEITPDYNSQVLQLTHVLVNSRISKLWITSRNDNNHRELEDRLGTFSYALKQFTPADQREHLRQLWGASLALKNLEESRFNAFATRLMESFLNLKDHQAFLGVPLQMRMIATIFRKDFESFYHSGKDELSASSISDLSKTLNLVSLFDEFFRIKFDEVLFGEKMQTSNKLDPKIARTLRNEYKLTMAEHESLSLCAFLSEDESSILLSVSDWVALLKKVSIGEEKLGIVLRVEGGKPIFAHQTYAEYFLARFLWAKFSSVSTAESESFVRSYFIQVLVVKGMLQVCYFLQLMAQRDKETEVETSPGKLTALFSSLLPNILDARETSHKCAGMLLKIIEIQLSALATGSELLIQIIERMDLRMKMALISVASREGYIELLLCFKGHVDPSYLEKVVKESSWQQCPPVLAALGGYSQVFRVLMQKIGYDPSWKDCKRTNMLQSIWRSRSFLAIEYCIDMDLIDGGCFEKGEGDFIQLPLVNALQIFAPPRIVKKLMERTNIEQLNNFQSEGRNIVHYVVEYMLVHDDLTVEYFTGKNVNLSQAVNALIALFNLAFVKERVPSYNGWIAERIRTNSLFDIIKQYFINGVIYNRRDTGSKLSTRQHVQQSHYIQKLIGAIVDNDIQNTPDMLLQAIVIGMKENTPHAHKAHLLLDFSTDWLCLVSKDFMRRSGGGFGKTICVPAFSEQKLILSWFAYCCATNVAKFEAIAQDCIAEYMKNGRRFPSNDRLPTSLNKLECVCLYFHIDTCFKNCSAHEAFREISTKMRKTKRYIEILSSKRKGTEWKLYDKKDILDCLDLDETFSSEEMKSFMEGIVENEGLPFLNMLWKRLSNVGPQQRMRDFQEMLEFAEQCSPVHDLFKRFDDCYRGLMDVIDTKQGTIVDVLSCIEPEFSRSVINGQDCDYGSPLHFASFKGNLKAIEDLLELGAEPNNKLEEDGIIRRLLSVGEDSNDLKHFMPLHLAAIGGHHEVAQRLIRKGAKIIALTESGCSPLYFAIVNEHLAVVRTLVLAGGMSIVGHLWATLANTEKTTIMGKLLQMLPEKQSQIDQLHWHLNTCLQKLFDAIYENDQLVLQDLSNEETSFKQVLISAREDDHGSPLHYAATLGHLEMVKALLEHGADPNHQLQTETAARLPLPRGVPGNIRHFTPLHLAVAHGHITIVEELSGCSRTRIDTAAASGWTALHFAARLGHADILKLLIRWGANWETITLEYETVRSLIEERCPLEKKETLKIALTSSTSKQSIFGQW